MSDLIKRLAMSHMARHRVILGNAEVELRILTEADYLQAGIASRELVKDDPMDAVLAEIYEQRKSAELLARAILDPASDKPVFDNADALESTLNRVQKRELLAAYLDFERQHSPRQISDEELTDILDEVKKTPELIHSLDFSSDTLKRLLRISVLPPVS